MGFHASTAKGTGLIPGQGTKIPQATQHSQNTHTHTHTHTHTAPARLEGRGVRQEAMEKAEGSWLVLPVKVTLSG